MSGQRKEEQNWRKVFNTSGGNHGEQRSCCSTNVGTFTKEKEEPFIAGFSKNKSLRKMVNFVGALLSGLLIILIPKCPMCLAAYIAVGTGIGVSFTVAGYIKIMMIAICVVSFFYFVFKRRRRMLKKAKGE